MPARHVTPQGLLSDMVLALSKPTPVEEEMEGPECYRLYRLCECGNCGGTGKIGAVTPLLRNEPVGYQGRCKECRGEGKTLDLVATCGNPEAVGVALCTLAAEGEWDECPIGIMFRPEGQTGKWLVKPWLPSARNISDAGRTLAKHRFAPQP